MWQPIADPETSRRCWSAIEAIERGLVGSTSPDGGPRLASGHAGLALFFAYLGAARACEETSDRALAALDRSIAGLAESLLPPSLYSGFSGIGWAAEHLARELFEMEDDLSADLEEALREILSSAGSLQFELINGLSGFGVYLIERLPRPGAAELLGRIVDRLAATAEESESGIAWFTPPEWIPDVQKSARPDGCYNLGVSHGVPGVLGFLAAARRAGLGDGRIAHLAEGTVRWLLRQKLPESARSVFASSFAPGEAPAPAHTAWCYGDIGVAAVLLSAARAFGRADWQEEALAIARLAARRSPGAAGIREAGLCHGTAGLAQIFNRFHQATGDGEMKEAALAWCRRTLEMERSWQAEPGFLLGAAGVGLALLAAVSSVEPAWDRVLLTSIPPDGLA